MVELGLVQEPPPPASSSDRRLVEREGSPADVHAGRCASRCNCVRRPGLVRRQVIRAGRVRGAEPHLLLPPLERAVERAPRPPPPAAIKPAFFFTWKP